jgi:hypothetical protein
VYRNLNTNILKTSSKDCLEVIWGTVRRHGTLLLEMMALRTGIGKWLKLQRVP